MAERARTPPERDRALGLGFYITSTPGRPGEIKGTWEEFRVTEISTYPRPDPNGPYSVLRVVSRGWEQHELGAAIARRLGIPARAVQWSGTKDRRAVADRLLAYRGPSPSRGFDLPNVELVASYRARDGLVLGHHYGNSFEVRVGRISGTVDRAISEYRATEEELRTRGGFPNFFGPQRFGEVRPITHEVGRAVVQGDLARAIDVYLIDRPAGGTPGEGDTARAAYADHRDPRRALSEFPVEYRFERSLLERLARGESPARAFHALPRELRLLFVHAYQAHLFNRWLTRRWEEALPLDRPVPGDRILRMGRDGTYRSRDDVPVQVDNRTECEALVARGRAQVAGPLVGTASPVGSERPGELLAALLREDDVAPAQFGVPVAPELSSAGAWRPILLPAPPLALTPDGDGVWFRFALPKGAYATVFLREFLKSGAVGGPADTVPGSPDGAS